jgi:hypothetical protein
MICPLLTHDDMPAAMAELEGMFGLEIVWLTIVASIAVVHGGTATVCPRDDGSQPGFKNKYDHVFTAQNSPG